MTSDLTRDERVLADLAVMLPVPEPRDLPANRSLVLREHMMNELRRAGAPARPAVRRGRWPAWQAAVMAAVAALCAAAVVLAVLSADRTPARPVAARPTAAAVLLDKIAAVAARQPAPHVRDSQFTYVATVVRAPAPGACLLQNPICRYFVTHGVLPPYETRVWESVSDLCRTGLVHDPLATPVNMPLTSTGPCPYRGDFNDPTYRFLQSLPTSPRALLARIYTAEKGQGPGPAAEAFTTIGDLLRSSVAPPQLSAALYRAAALIPGVTVVPDAVDALGRHGVAVSYTQMNPRGAAPARPTGVREQWIFGRATLQWLGERTVTVPRGTVTEVSATVQRGFVDRPGQVPPRS